MNPPNYIITWGHYHAPHGYGFDVPVTALEGFSSDQRRALDGFRRLLWREMQIRVVTRARATLMDNWRFMTLMPLPTPAACPLYNCRYVVDQKALAHIKNIPAIGDSVVQQHHAYRTKGWTNTPPGFLHPRKIVSLYPDGPLTFINERENEVIKTVGLLREAEHQKSTYLDILNREYTFDLWPVSARHGVRDTFIDQYFYAVLDVTPPGLRSDSFVEQGLALPKLGTPVVVTSRSRSSQRDRWTGIVINPPRFTPGVQIPPNAVCIRLKRSENFDSVGSVLQKTGFVTFGQPNPAFVQQKSAIHYAMYGSREFEVPRTNKLKTLLLAHDNETINEAASSRRATFCHSDGLSTEYQAYCQGATIRSGPGGPDNRVKLQKPCETDYPPSPGTGKTSVTARIALFHRGLNNPLLIVCGSNHALDVVTRRLLMALDSQDFNKDGVYRLDTEFGEDADSQMAPGIPNLTGDNDEVFDKTMQELRRLGIDPLQFRLLRSSIEASVTTDRPASLGQHIISRLKLAVEKGSSWSQLTSDSQEEMRLLWTFITYQQCLAREGLMFAEPVELPRSQGVQLQEDPAVIHKRFIQGLRRSWLELQEFYIERAKIVLCTASTASRTALRKFTVIVEEASEMTETVCLNSIVRYYRSAKNVVLSGDIAQLPPTVTSVNRNGFFDSEKLSLFERLLRTGVPHVSLSRQYRMHPDISEFVSHEFYGNRLIDDASAIRRNSTVF